MLAPYSADTPVNDSTHSLVEVSSAVQPAPTDRGATVESRSAGQPAAADHAEVRTLEVAGLRVNTKEPPRTQSRENAVPANLRETALGGRLLQRMMAQDWLPISMQDIPKKWLTAATRAPQYLEHVQMQMGGNMSGRLSSTLALSLPDEAACWIYKDWFDKCQSKDKYDIPVLMESTASFQQAYGLTMYNRTLLRLAVHGKPEGVVVEVFGEI